ncbi:hypothetical protein [Natronosalvus caseinilyticus]|uniref:hypothetical protein n=1 Tax=Natronosalvus caseinilyticus TaxID=2953747 RepID=UPI0028AF1FC2|nr:hypothetical protein [Natronosalvus caseinilyticus]
MVSARTPRVFNLYDVLGVFFPGTALLVGLFVIVPGLPSLDSVISYLAFIVVAFSLGHILQSYASLSVGNLKIFDETIRNVQSPIDSLDTSDDAETDDDDAEEETDETETTTDTFEEEGSEQSNQFWLYLLHAFTGPFIGPISSFIKPISASIEPISSFIESVSSPNGGEIKDLRNPNRVWRNLYKNYDFGLGSTRYEEMLQIISSRIDDPGSPTRSYRFQAIRNFQRGMWVTAWILFATLFATSLPWGIRAVCGSAEEHLLAQSYLLTHFPLWLVLVLGGITVLIFWWLTIQYEKLFVRFLITDYVVLIAQNNQVQQIRIVEDN